MIRSAKQQAAFNRENTQPVARSAEQVRKTAEIMEARRRIARLQQGIEQPRSANVLRADDI